MKNPPRSRGALATGFLLFVSALLVPTPGHSRSGSSGAELLASVNGDSVTMADLEAEIAGLGGGSPGDSIPLPDPEAVLRRLIQNRLFEQEGYRIGFDSIPQVRRQVADLVRRRATAALLDSITATVPPPDSSEVDSLLGAKNRMNRVAHILVGEESVAHALLDSLAAGASFADLAARHSIDSVSAVRGGDLGWAREGMFVPEFEAAVRGLSAGEVGGPVKTVHGWHLIQLEETREESYGRSEKMRGAVVDAVRRDRVSSVLGGFTRSLKAKYEVVVHDSLLRSLDYASSDPSVQERLRTSDDVLLDSRAGRLTVRGLTRTILFQYFHGLAGKPEASAIRDKMFDDWVSEALLGREALELGFDRRPEILRGKRELERRLVREEALKTVLGFSYDPDEREVGRYYEEHRDQYVPPRRFKVRSAVLDEEENARAFRSGLEEGAEFGWLASRSAGIVETDPPPMAGWLEPADVGVKAEDLAVGGILGPVRGPGGWMVAEITAVEEREPLPLAECRERVIREMRAERAREAVTGAVAKLEAAASIEIRPGAEERIGARLERWGEEQRKRGAEG